MGSNCSARGVEAELRAGGPVELSGPHAEHSPVKGHIRFAPVELSGPHAEHSPVKGHIRFARWNFWVAQGIDRLQKWPVHEARSQQRGRGDSGAWRQLSGR